MGTFFDAPTVGTRTAFALPGVNVQKKTYLTNTNDGDGGSTVYTAPPMPVSFDEIPWGGGITGNAQPGAGAPNVTDFTPWQTAIDNATATAATRQVALTEAVAERDAAQAVIDAAQTALDEANATLTDLEKTAFVAWLGLLAAQGGTDAALIADYTERNTLAVQAVVAQRAVLGTRRNALTTATAALVPKQAAVDGFAGFDDGAAAVQAATLELTLAAYAVGTVVGSGPPSPPYYNPYTSVGAGYLASSSSTEHSTTTSHGVYRLTFILNDGQYRQLAADGGHIAVRWTEVTYAQDATGTSYDAISSAVQKSKTLQASEGTPLTDGSGRWFFTTGENAVPAPSGNSYVIITGPEKVKNYTSFERAELRGAEASRQGWREYATDPAAAYGRRYLTMTLSAAANAPQGNHYAGTYSLLDPDFTTVTDPAILGAIVGQALPDDANPVALVSSVLDPVTRVLHNPPGLQLTLSGEETPGSIASTVAAACVFDDPTVTGSILSVPGAINHCPASGDYAAKQTLRYKVAYTSASQRGRDTSAYSDYFEITRRTTNLTTGIVTVEQVPFTITFAYTPPESGTPATGVPSPSFTDTDYTVLGVPDPMTLVEVFGSASESTDPSTPYGEPTLTFVAAPAPTARPGTSR